MSADQQFEDLAELTWPQLEDWAGARTVRRGKTYRHRVHDLRATADNVFLATVSGTAVYATLVQCAPGGDLRSRCTCPYPGTPCKHAVAVVLAVLAAIEDEDDLQAMAVDDPRLAAIERATGADDMSAVAARPSAQPAPTATECRDYVQSLPEADLRRLVLDWLTEIPAVQARLRRDMRLAAADIPGLLAATREAITACPGEDQWMADYGDRDELPDYEYVRGQFEALLAAGHADEVVALGDDLLRRSHAQLEVQNCDGEVARELGGCLDVVMRALAASSWPPARRLLWLSDAMLGDDYEILEVPDSFRGVSDDYPAAAWSELADVLAARLTAAPTDTDSSMGAAPPGDYARQALMRMVIKALDHAGRSAEVLAILEQEVAVTACYVELVDRLLAAGQPAAAREQAKAGYAATVRTLPGIANQLRERLLKMAERAGDRLAVAAYSAAAFLDCPDVDGYIALREAGGKAAVWDAVRPTILRYLESGEPPADATDPPWPLPDIGLERPSRFSPSFPLTDTLVRIALHEGRHDDAIQWRERRSRSHGSSYGALDDTLAAAVADSHPDLSLRLWRQRAEALIALVKPSAYQQAGGYLRRMERLYAQLDRQAEWQSLLDDLRQTNRRRPRMIDVLDRLEGKRRPIIGG